MSSRVLLGALAIGTAALLPYAAVAQTTENDAITEETTPGAAGVSDVEGDVPAVEIIQPQEEPRPEPVSRPAAQPVEYVPPPVEYVPPPPSPTEAAFEPIEPEEFVPTLITQELPEFNGPPGAAGAFERAMNSAQSPVNPLNGILPGNLQDFSEAGSRVTRQQINEQEPLTTNDIMQRVPGVTVVNDDGLGRHGGIGIRGSNPRRGRKVLVMEDGQSINMSLYIDPSVHYVPPPDRIESVEVVKGSIIYAPNNNFGAVNFRNLQPFGPNETVVSGQGGGVAADGIGFDNDGSAAKWHIHNRQTWGDWGTVVSYTGADVQGAWDTERLRYNDFYAALGWRGDKADFTFSGSYLRQRDNYDEANLELDDPEDGVTAEDVFFNEIGHCKSCFNPGSRFNTYNADPTVLQATMNYYFDLDTTLTSRAYFYHHRRDRYQNFEGENPAAFQDNFNPFFADDDVALIPEGVMLARLRTYQHFGFEERLELANRQLFGGITQDMQFGLRYENHTFTNRNFFGKQGQILKDGDTRGLTVFDREHEANAYSAYFQTVIHATPALDIVPGIRLEHYNQKRVTKALDEDDDELDGCEFDGREFFGGEDCVAVDVNRNSFSESFDRTIWLPGISFSYGLFGKQVVQATGDKSLQEYETVYHTTLYGGYNRGLTMPILRDTVFPPEDELGDNFQLGVRSTGVKGVTFDVAGFHKRIENYQIKNSATDFAGNNIFTNVNQVEIDGFEIYSRFDSRPFTGWSLNPYFEGTFTYADGEITSGVNDEGESLVGNRVPFSPREVAYLTTGIESTAGWNASVSFVYRGSFFTDSENTPYKGDPEGENGLVPSVWLVNARANYTVPQNLMPNADVVLFVSGENLANELYITDREDGIKPGLGRSIMAGSRIKW